MVLGKLEHTCKNMKLDPFFTPYTRTNSNCIKDLNARLKTIKILQENSKIQDISQSNIFSDISPQAREARKKINQWDYIKLKSFPITKGAINKMKRQPTE